MRLREKERERKAKYAFLAAAIKRRDQPGPNHPRTELKTPPPTPDPASNATSRDTGQRHAQTHGTPQKHAQPVANGDTGRWTAGPHLPDLESGMSTGMPWRI